MPSRKFISLLLAVLTAAAGGFAADMVTICPYLGQLHDVQSSSKAPTAGNALLKGIFAQGRSDRYQLNGFFYQSSDISHSDIWGANINGDVYFHKSVLGSWVAGAGAEYLYVTMNSASVGPVVDMSMHNHILVPYVRGGYKFRLQAGIAECSLFPWVGIQDESVWGSMSGSIPISGHGPVAARASAFTESAARNVTAAAPMISIPIDTSFSQNDFYAMTGLNFHAMLMHMVEFEAKYHAAWNDAHYQNNVAIMVNYFFLRYLGLSYRYRYLETTQGSDRFNMIGVAVSF